MSDEHTPNCTYFDSVDAECTCAKLTHGPLTFVSGAVGRWPGATTITRCARCSTTLDSNAEVKGHEERCFVVGDYVEWRGGTSTHISGEVISIRHRPNCLADEVTIRVDYDRMHPSPTSWQGTEQTLYTNQLRRIPAPVAQLDDETIYRCMSCSEMMTGWSVKTRRRKQGRCYCGGAIETEAARADRLARLAHRDVRPENVVQVDPLDVRYDGLGMLELLCRDQLMRRNDSRDFPPFTPAQRAAVSAHWSAELRARVAQQKERERMRIVVDPSDMDGEPW